MKKVYFLSGTMNDERLWQWVFPKLEQLIPVYIDITPAKSFEAINELIADAIDEEGILIGFSLGGFSALNFTLKFPGKVSKLMMICAAADGLNEEEVRLRKSTIHFLESHNYKGISATRIQQFVHPKARNYTAIAALIREMDATLGKDTLIRQLKATSERKSLMDKVAMLTMPVFLLGASHDLLVNPDSMEDMYLELENASFEIISETGHMIPLEQPEILAHKIHHFVFS
ncbi:MAG: alpha/beta hydrolase [Flavobacteriaceae bacterium]|nr:alpha/beta hydrolase [Flavobacteriaceae bacterium]